MDNVPVWAIALALLALLFGASELGFWLRWRKRRDAMRTSNDDEGHVLSVSLGLLGLLIGFTFAMALARYDLKRELVVREASAISSVYDSAGLLEEPHRTSLRSELRVYIDARLRYSFQQPRIEQSYRETNLLQSALLRHAEEALAPMRQTSLATSMIGGLSEM